MLTVCLVHLAPCMCWWPGENESSALLKEINKTKQMRPLTHDLLRSMLMAIGYKVTKMRITEIVNSTYFARVHLSRAGSLPVRGVGGRARSCPHINLLCMLHGAGAGPHMNLLCMLQGLAPT